MHRVFYFRIYHMHSSFLLHHLPSIIMYITRGLRVGFYPFACLHFIKIAQEHGLELIFILFSPFCIWSGSQWLHGAPCSILAFRDEPWRPELHASLSQVQSSRVYSLNVKAKWTEYAGILMENKVVYSSNIQRQENA